MQSEKKVHIWLRAEPITSTPSRGDLLQSETDNRAPLIPQDAKQLVDSGRFIVTVERSEQRVFPDEEYQNAGCTLVPYGSWTEAPLDAYVLGIRGFPTRQTLYHRHIYFGHAFKNQPDWHAKLVPFLRGGGLLYDLEYLTDKEGRRLTSYGPVAGMIGMAAGILAWCTQAMAAVGVTIPTDLLVKLQSMGLVEHLKSLLSMAVTFAHKTPKVIVIGHKGRVGAKAVAMAQSLGLEVDGWGREDTKKKGPYPELLKYQILVNAIKLDADQRVGPFLTHELIRQQERNLSVVVDISCDTLNPVNPLPIYSQPTTFTHPTVRVIEGNNPLDVIAIPTLPSLVPAVSSQDFSAQLLPLLLELDNSANEVWQRAEAVFREKTKELRPTAVPRSVLLSSDLPLLSFAQERIWKLTDGYNQQIKASQSEEEKKERERKVKEEGESIKEGEESVGVYNVVKAFEVSGDVEAFAKTLPSALEKIVDRHEILRVTFIPSKRAEEPIETKEKEKVKKGDDESEEEALTVSSAPVKVAVRIQDTKDVDIKGIYKVIEESTENSLEAVYNSELSTPFAFLDGGKYVPLFRVVLLVKKGDKNSASLIVSSNRLVADEWSLQLLAEELLAGRADPLALQYLDFAHWQRSVDAQNTATVKENSALKQEEGNSSFGLDKRSESSTLKELTYWRTKLSGSPPVVQIPIDRQRQPLQSFNCMTEVRVLSKELSEELKKAAIRLAGLEMLGEWVSKEDVSSALCTTLLALYKLILFRLSGEEDSVIGSTVSGRLRREVFDVVGPFANTLLLRSHVHDQLTFEELYRSTDIMLREALRNQGTPFEKILGELGKSGAGEDLTVKHAPLFQVGFEYADNVQNPLGSKNSGPLSLVREVPLQKKLSPHDFTLHVSPNLDAPAKGIEIRVTYNSDLLDKERIDETLSEVELLLRHVLADTKKRIVEYPLITERARKLLPDPTLPLDSSWLGPIHEMLTKQAAAHPDRLAVYYDGKTMTYGWLETKTNELADCLIQSGVKKGDVIAIYGHRSPAVVVSILGILKSGAAYSMMDPKYPASRIIDCLTVAKIDGWIQIADAGELPQQLSDYLATLSLRCQLEVANVYNDEDNKTVKHPHIFGGQFKKTPPENVKIDGEDVAVVTFTSGSTGMPKGVQGRHLPLTHFYPWMHERFGIGPDDKFSMCSGIAHDPLQRDIFTPVFFGASIYIPTDETIATPGKLGEWMSTVGINVSCLTPAMGQLLTTLDNPNFSITTLKGVFFVGDLLIKRDVFRLKKLAPNSFIINMYGSTETQRAVGYWEVPPLEVVHGLRQVMPVGVGMKDVDLLLLNSAGLQAGVGEVAEIYVRSPHLAKGYLGLEEETRKKFILNPFITHEKQEGAADRFYRTGDLGRYMPDGLVECIGRADDQVKIRGFRIELGEINAQLSQHKCVKENVTVIREDKVGQKRLVSYVVPTEFDDEGKPVLNKDIDAETFAQHCREFLKKKLPQYMVPTRIVVLQSMPLTPNGKINRPALPDPFTGPTSEAPARVKILTSTQQDLVNVWSKLLGLNTVNIDDDFFEDLGGHSLLATQAVFQMSETFHINMPVNLLFGSPTIEALARWIDQVKAHGAGAAITDGKQEKPEDSLDLLKEAQSLDPAVAVPKGTPLPSSDVANVFLTGSTGFLGSFLLRDLLELTKATVYCHLRAPSVEKGKERLKQSLSAHGLWKDEYADRLVPVPGDLAVPLLGIEPAEFERLANVIDVIVHNGAFVHWLKPYKSLKASNVLGTQETLRLATTGKLKRVHYISTTSVYDTEYHAKVPVLHEDNLPEYKGISGGYPQSKWVADKMMIIAREERNIPVSIYRPGYITGDTQNGLWNTDDFLCRFIKGCIQLGAAPIIDPSIGLDMSPVDYVSKAVVAILSANHNNLDALNRNHNVINPALTTYQSLFDSILFFGYPLEMVKYSEWRKLLMESAASQKDNALNALLGHFSESWESQLKSPKYDNSNVTSALKDSSVTCPPIDNQIIARYFTYLIGCGFMHAPPRTPNNDLAIDWEKIKEGVSLLSRTNRS